MRTSTKNLLQRLSPRLQRLPTIPVLCLAVASSYAQENGEHAASAPSLSPVVVTGSRIESESFDLPYSIDSIDMREARRGNLGANVSEVLGSVPGVVVQNRQNYAQDLQISIRGFGARAAFGVRGVKLIADGIPATSPDGQGQAATFNLDTAERIEVLRGPFSSVYGNHSGGVIQLFSRDGEGPPMLRGGVTAGAWGTTRVTTGAEGEVDGVSYLVDASRFETDGFRRYGAAVREQGFAKLRFTPTPDTRVTLVANSLQQPFTEDPQGLTWDSFRRDPRAVEAPARDFRTRKRIRNQQGGVTIEQQFGPHTLELSAYAGERRVVQYLSIPVAAQLNPRAAGGVVDLDRSFHGAGIRWSARQDFGDERRLTMTAGFDYDRSVDQRAGYENFIGDRRGVRGALRRDERNSVTSADPYVQATWAHGRWEWSAGARYSTVRFRVSDDYVVGANRDDSGSVSYRELTPAFGVVYRVDPAVNLYLSAGSGFETPTLNELSYSSADGGFNFGLKPARSQQLEAGIKAIVGERSQVQAAVFEVRTRDELIVQDSSDGRTSFANAARTLRRGLELSASSAITPTLSAQAALTLLDAVYDRDFVVDGGGTTPTRVRAGNRLPGVPRVSAFVELEWEPLHGVSIAAEALYRGDVPVDDLNRAHAAPAHTLVNLRLATEQAHGPWSFGQLVRVDNLFDRSHVSSVIVGQGQGRYYEPGPSRSVYAGLNLRYRF